MNADAKHTPRPWKADARYDNYAVRLVGADGRFIASSSWSDNSENSKFYPSKEETFKNFSMIATAVNSFEDLLTTLKDTKEELRDILPDMRDEEFDLRFGRIDAAIAKAEARS
ncbi:hypothetical protein JZX86_05705 [Agrobacterium rosae]|uniref:hypothetical protein n=1 Tax=Agrobacterium rosae TaxID=1972867 RepID=UPI0019D3E193|nr:hypothetical protein [Agrobacterium rosae]MBN7804858.1 hypothetical protein [Agrobacterium rosae]